MKNVLDRLGIVEAIDAVMEHQPEIGATYGTLAQVVIINRLGVLMEALAKHAAEIWKKAIVCAVAQFSVALEWLHANATSVYFEGTFMDKGTNNDYE